MRNMLAFLAAVALTVIGAGWYLDWYKVQSNPAPAGKRSLSIDINTTRIGEDLHKGEQKLQGMLDNSKSAGTNNVPGAGATANKTGKTEPAQIPQPGSRPAPEGSH